MTKAPHGGETAGPSPVDRRKGGLKRSVASDGDGIPLGLVSAPAHGHDLPLLAPTLAAARSQAAPMAGGSRRRGVRCPELRPGTDRAVGQVGDDERSYRWSSLGAARWWSARPPRSPSRTFLSRLPGRASHARPPAYRGNRGRLRGRRWPSATAPPGSPGHRVTARQDLQPAGGTNGHRSCKARSWPDSYPEAAADHAPRQRCRHRRLEHSPRNSTDGGRACMVVRCGWGRRVPTGLQGRGRCGNSAAPRVCGRCTHPQLRSRPQCGNGHGLIQQCRAGRSSRPPAPVVNGRDQAISPRSTKVEAGCRHWPAARRK
jgi:hypothetical protein